MHSSSRTGFFRENVCFNIAETLPPPNNYSSINNNVSSVTKSSSELERVSDFCNPYYLDVSLHQTPFDTCFYRNLQGKALFRFVIPQGYISYEHCVCVRVFFLRQSTALGNSFSQHQIILTYIFVFFVHKYFFDQVAQFLV